MTSFACSLMGGSVSQPRVDQFTGGPQGTAGGREASTTAGPLAFPPQATTSPVGRRQHAYGRQQHRHRSAIAVLSPIDRTSQCSNSGLKNGDCTAAWCQSDLSRCSKLHRYSRQCGRAELRPGKRWVRLSWCLGRLRWERVALPLAEARILRFAIYHNL